MAGFVVFDFMHCTLLRSEVLAHNLAPQRLNQFLGIKQCGKREYTTKYAKVVEVLEYQTAEADWDGIQKQLKLILPNRFQRALGSERILSVLGELA